MQSCFKTSGKSSESFLPFNYQGPPHLDRPLHPLPASELLRPVQAAVLLATDQDRVVSLLWDSAFPEGEAVAHTRGQGLPGPQVLFVFTNGDSTKSVLNTWVLTMEDSFLSV